MYACLHVGVCMYVWMHVCMYGSLYVCMYACTGADWPPEPLRAHRASGHELQGHRAGARDDDPGVPGALRRDPGQTQALPRALPPVGPSSRTIASPSDESSRHVVRVVLRDLRHAARHPQARVEEDLQDRGGGRDARREGDGQQEGGHRGLPVAATAEAGRRVLERALASKSSCGPAPQEHVAREAVGREEEVQGQGHRDGQVLRHRRGVRGARVWLEDLRPRAFGFFYSSVLLEPRVSETDRKRNRSDDHH